MRRIRGVVREEIVRVAAVCFGEMGYRAATLDTIAAKAGVSKVTLYKHVASKEDLLWAVFERTLASFQQGLAEIVRQDLGPDEKLRRIISHQVHLLTSNLPFLTVFFSEESGLPPHLATRVAREKREYDRAIERVVRQGIRQGLIRELPPTVVVFALLGMANWLYKWFRPEGTLGPAEISAFFVDLLERGYLKPATGQSGDHVLRALRAINRRLTQVERRLAPRSG
jgi:TetR/AcrR family transcriptional regulator, cholesterol catabolism regulator